MVAQHHITTTLHWITAVHSLVDQDVSLLDPRVVSRHKVLCYCVVVVVMLLLLLRYCVVVVIINALL